MVGHSMGGLTGLLWAKTWPGDLAKLMVVDSLPFTGDIFVPNALATPRLWLSAPALSRCTVELPAAADDNQDVYYASVTAVCRAVVEDAR